MFEVDHDTPPQTIIPLFIAIAPRDPREQAPTHDDAVDFLEPVTVDETGDALLELAIPAQLLDGADIGSPGWILARTLGTEDGAILRWAPTENTRHGHLPTMNVDDVAAHLAHELNTACHISNDPHIPSGAPQTHLEGVSVTLRSGAIIGTFESTEGPLLAATAHTPIWFSHQGTTGVVAGADPAANLEDILTTGSLTPLLALERQGQARRVTIARRGQIMAVHEFGPRWIDVDPRGIDDYALPGEEFDTVDLVFDYYEPPQADADDFATHYELTTEQHNQLTAILDAETPDDPFTGIVRILGLPDEAAEVAEGWRDPHDLPAAELFHPKRLGAALWDSLTTLPTENTVNARMHRAWITRPPMFFALNTLETALIGIWTARQARRGRTGRTLLGAALIAVNIADMVTPSSWRDRRLRSTHLTDSQ